MIYTKDMKYGADLWWKIVVLGGAALLYACNQSPQGQEQAHVETSLAESANEVRTVVIHPVDFDHELVSNGTVAAQERADLSFESPDLVTEIYVKNGDRVGKGQKIAMLTQFKLENALKQAEDNLEKAKLELQDVLISQGYVLRDSLKIPDEILKIAKVKSNYENSVIQQELALFNLQNSVLYAPHDGVIANLFTKAYNMPPASEPFCTVIGSKAADVDFMVLESELGLVQVGDRVQISPFAIGEYTVSGRVIEINPIVDEQGMVRVKARIQQQSDRLFEGMNIKVHVKRSVGKQLVIPKSALVLRNNRKVVFTLRQGKAFWNYVETGPENASGYVVSEGLNTGDTVIYEGNLNLAHETPVKLLQNGG